MYFTLSSGTILVYSMSSSVQPFRRPLRVLCLDGGGVRGLSSLMILQDIMREVAAKEGIDDAKPCDFFDLICGTSTGGLIAIILGRPRMSVGQAIDIYLQLSASIFVPKGIKSQIRSKATKFSAKALEQAIQEVLTHAGLDGQARMYDDRPDRCHTFVLSVWEDASDSPRPHCFTTYEPKDETKIWEAARATSAAPTFFKSISVGNPKIKYIDAGLGFNNPSEQGRREALKLYRNDIGLLISIGTGRLSIVALGRDAIRLPFGLGLKLSLAKALSKLYTSAEAIHDSLLDCFPGTDVYTRFNVDRGMEDIGLGEWDKEDRIAAATAAYLNNGTIPQMKDNAVTRLRQLSHRPIEILVSAKEFTALEEGQLDSEYPSMAFWYREDVDPQTGYPPSVRVPYEFQNSLKPVDNHIISCRRIVNLLLRAQLKNVPHGRYRVLFLIWYFDHPVPSPEDNSVIGRRFSPIREDGIKINEPGTFLPFDLKFCVGRPLGHDSFLSRQIDVTKTPNHVPEFLEPGYLESLVRSGWWNTLKKTGWREVECGPFDVSLDGLVAFTVSKDFVRGWYGGFSFGGVRLAPISTF